MGTTDSPHDRITAANGACAGDLETRSQACDRAADDMADRLSGLADRLGTALRPQRMPFGKGRLAGALRRRSPAGFVLDAVNLQMLLTDGRLWSYSRSSSLGAPAGTYFDVRAHHSRFAASPRFFRWPAIHIPGPRDGHLHLRPGRSTGWRSGHVGAVCAVHRGPVDNLCNRRRRSLRYRRSGYSAGSGPLRARGARKYPTFGPRWIILRWR